MTFLIISNFILLGIAAYLWGRHQILVGENARLLEDNQALLTKTLARHGFTPLHETAEVKSSRQEQAISLVPPIHAAIHEEEEVEEREYFMSGLSEDKKAELREEARRRA
jgi:hypothetical protein